MLLTRETQLETPQIYIKKWPEGPEGPSSERLLTQFPHPHPSIKDLQKEVIRCIISNYNYASAPYKPALLAYKPTLLARNVNVHKLVVMDMPPMCQAE